MRAIMRGKHITPYYCISTGIMRAIMRGKHITPYYCISTGIMRATMRGKHITPHYCISYKGHMILHSPATPSWQAHIPIGISRSKLISGPIYTPIMRVVTRENNITHFTVETHHRESWYNITIYFASICKSQHKSICWEQYYALVPYHNLIHTHDSHSVITQTLANNQNQFTHR